MTYHGKCPLCSSDLEYKGDTILMCSKSDHYSISSVDYEKAWLQYDVREAKIDKEQSESINQLMLDLGLTQSQIEEVVIRGEH